MEQERRVTGTSIRRSSNTCETVPAFLLSMFIYIKELKFCGRWGVRTPGPPEGSPAFETGAINQTLPTYQVPTSQGISPRHLWTAVWAIWGGCGIRTHGPRRISDFQDRCHKPLGQPSLFSFYQVTVSSYMIRTTMFATVRNNFMNLLFLWIDFLTSFNCLILCFKLFLWFKHFLTVMRYAN